MNFSDFFAEQKDLPLFVTIKIIPNAAKTEMLDLNTTEDFWKMRVKAIPEKGKANAEIEKFFRKNFGVTTKIISGKTDRKKLIKIEA